MIARVATALPMLAASKLLPECASTVAPAFSARSTGVALFAVTGAMGQLWLFWAAPLAGAAIGAALWCYLLAPEELLANIGGNAR